MIRASLALLLAALTCAAAVAREGNTYQDELRIYIADLDAQCKSVRQQLDSFRMGSDPLTGYNLQDAVQSLCHCLPEKTEAFKATLTEKELARNVSAEEYVRRFNPAVIDLCAGEQMRALYGDDCRKRFRKAGVDVKSYCACMQEVVRGYPDATIAAIAAAADEYLPLAAEAQQNGQPVPARPAVLDEYFQADQGCKSGKRSGRYQPSGQPPGGGFSFDLMKSRYFGSSDSNSFFPSGR